MLASPGPCIPPTLATTMALPSGAQRSLLSAEELAFLFKSTWSFLLVSRRSPVLSIWAPGGHRDDLSSGWGRERARSLSTEHRVAGRNDYIMKVHIRLGCWQ